MAEAMAVDTVAVRLMQHANNGDWDAATQVDGPQQALAMLRMFIYADVEFWKPPWVQVELEDHGCPVFVAETEALTTVLFHDIPQQDADAVREFRTELTCRGVSAKDARWLGEVLAWGHADSIVTFDGKLIRGLGGEVHGLVIAEPEHHWARLNILPGAKPLRRPAMSHPLSHVDEWKW